VCAKWKGYDPEPLVAALNHAKEPDPISNRIVFPSFVYDDVIAVMHSAVEFREWVPEFERGEIFRDAVDAVGQAAGAKGKITSKALIWQVSQLERRFLQLPRRRFVMATSLTMRHTDVPRRVDLSGCRITFRPYLTGRISLEHRKAAEERSDLFPNGLPGTYSTPPTREFAQKWISVPPRLAYTAVRVSVWARSEHEAWEVANDALDLLRGLWNMALLLGKLGPPFPEGRRRPVNPIVRGPLHTLHTPSGKLAGGLFWYEPIYAGPVEAPSPGTIYRSQMTKFEKDARRYLTRSPYRDKVEDVIRRYTRALDTRDWNTALVQLWSIVEDLTGEKPKQEQIIDRISFLYDAKERSYHRLVLKHLADYRNSTVHAGREMAEVSVFLYQLKRYAEQLMTFHLFRAPAFASLQEAVQFLSLPTDTTKLQKQMDLRRRALRFHSKP
jgi:hypothetical protein